MLLRNVIQLNKLFLQTQNKLFFKLKYKDYKNETIILLKLIIMILKIPKIKIHIENVNLYIEI